MKSTSTNNYSSSPTSVFCIFHSPLYLYQFEHNIYFGNIDLEKSCGGTSFIFEKSYTINQGQNITHCT